MFSTLGYFAKTAKVKYNILLHEKLQIQSAKGTHSKAIWGQPTLVTKIFRSQLSGEVPSPSFSRFS